MKAKLLFILFFVSVFAQAQNPVINFKKLQTFLPEMVITDFTRSKPEGMTQTAMGISTSEASVVYNSDKPDSAGNTISVEVTISDNIFNPYVVMQFTMLGENYESESEDGYEKFTKIAGKYPGKISVTSTDFKSCQLDFAVGSRILVSLRCNGSDDIALLNKLVNSMKLDELAVLQP
ncbi:MAG: hypothetical protein L6Q47_16895 [Ignavibacteriaceae bacterium]|nr:hypothetical protein [Ignavibacteriaceae bacterium]